MPRAGVVASSKTIPAAPSYGAVLTDWYTGGGGGDSRNVSLGAPAAGRLVVVALMSQTTTNDNNIDLAIDGVSMGAPLRYYNQRNRQWIYSAVVPSGNAGLLSWDGNPVNTDHIYVWSLYGLTTGLVTEGVAAGGSTVTLGTNVGDILLASSMGWSNTSPPTAWTGPVVQVANGAASVGSSQSSAAAQGVAIDTAPTVGPSWINPSGTTVWVGAFR